MGFNPQNPNKYLGTDKYITFFVTRNRSPIGSDYRQPETGRNYTLGTIWQVGKNPTTGLEGDLWCLSKIVANVAYWIEFSSSSIGPLLSFTTPLGTSPVFPSISGNIALLSGGGLDITGGVNSITLTVTSSAFAWNDITSATQIITVQEGYITNRGAGVTYTLPATAAEGDRFRIAGKLGLWTIAQNANQKILVGSGSTTLGITGSVVATNQNDAIELLCTTAGASTIWTALSLIGNLTLN